MSFKLLNPTVLSAEHVMIGVYRRWKAEPVENTSVRIHTPLKRTPLFLGMLKDGGTTLPFCPQAASSYLQPISFFLGYAHCSSNSLLRMDQPAVGILQVCVQLFVFVQRLWGSEGQLSKESG